MSARSVTFPSGRKLVVSHTLDENELVQTLAILARAERVDGVLAERLAKSESAGGPEPEMYLQAIVDGIKGLFPALVENLLANLGRWMSQELGENLMVKANQMPSSILSQAQIDELVELIRATFRTAARPGILMGTFDTGADLERKWKSMGLIAPSVRLSNALNDAFVAGRLYAVLTENSSYADMHAAASGLPFSRAAALQQQVALRDASLYFLRPINEFASDVEERAQRVNNEVVRAVVNEYMDGTLKPTDQNRDGLSPVEVAATERAGQVTGWRQLAREMRNRMLGVEMGRDWSRVAATETRHVMELGKLAEFRERHVQFVSVRVQADACPFCKRLYLNPDGTMKRFAIEEIERNSAEAPFNIGHKASLIGRAGGWLPIIPPAHPWCRCVSGPSEHLELLYPGQVTSAAA